MTSFPVPSITRLRRALRPIIEIPLVGLLLVLAGALFLAAQRPLNYTLEIGREDGHGSDLPFVEGWHAAEAAGDSHFRWSAEDSHVRVAGLPPGPLALRLRLLQAPFHPQKGSAHVHLSSPAGLLASLPLGDQPRYVSLLLPLEARRGGKLDLHIGAPLWQPRGDERRVGAPIGKLAIAGVRDEDRSAFPVWAGVPVEVFWPLLVVALAWLPLRHWLPRQRLALVIAAALSGLLVLAFAADRLRFVLAGRPVILAMAWALLLALSLRVLLRATAPRLGIAPSAQLLDALVLLFFVLFTLRYCGRLYPFSMPGDQGFHLNRLQEVIGGHIFLLSRHRGINFPYPPALYFLLMPLRLLPITTLQLVEFFDALLGALGLFPLAYLILWWSKDEQRALWVATAYALLAPAIMALWWSFLPHIFAQEFAVLVIAGLVGGWHAVGTRRGFFLATASLTLLFATHFGFYLNMSLVLGGLLVLLLLAGVRGKRRGNRLVLLERGTATLPLAFLLAHLLVFVLFYSAFVPLFLRQLDAFRSGGMGAVQGGSPSIAPRELLGGLWQAGVVGHYATIGIPLGLLGAVPLLSRRLENVLPMLFVITILVALLQAAIPFITSSTITTRWLSSTAWALALGSGLLLDTLWRQSRSGQVLALAATGWLLWTTLIMWVHALAYRIRPPEPF